MFGFVNVLKCTLLQAPSRTVVFFVRDILMRLVQQLHRAVQASRPVHPDVNRRMFIDVLTVFLGGLLDFVDSLVDLVNGFSLFTSQLSVIRALEMRASGPQIRQGVKIRWML